MSKTIQPGEEIIGVIRGGETLSYEVTLGNHHMGIFTVLPLDDYGFELSVYDEDNKRIGQFVPGQRGQFTYGKIPLKVGRTFRVEVEPFYETTGEHEFLLKCDMMTDYVQETSRRNDEINKAQFFFPSQTVLGWIDDERDEDCYYTRADQDGILTFMLQSSESNTKVELAIFDEDENLIKRTKSGKGRPAYVETRVRAGEKYYIQVDAYDYVKGMQYAIWVEGVGSGGMSGDHSNVRIQNVKANKTEPFSVGEVVDFTITLKNHSHYVCPTASVRATNKDGLVFGVSQSVSGIRPNQEVEVRLPIKISGEGNYPIIFSTTSNAHHTVTKYYKWVTCSPLRGITDQYISSHPDLRDIEKEALRRIGLYGKEKICKGSATKSSSSNMEYSNDTIKDRFESGQLLLFLMEGAGNYANKGNPNHPNGRYGALTVAIKNKQIIALERETSTLPDYPYEIPNMGNPVWATVVDEGVYESKSGLHHGVEATIKIGGDRSIPSTQGTKGNREHTRANGIHFHRGFNNDNASAPSSEGCCLVSKPNAQAFFEKIGLVNKGVYIGDRNNPSKAYNDIECTVIINRELFDPNM